MEEKIIEIMDLDEYRVHGIAQIISVNVDISESGREEVSHTGDKLFKTCGEVEEYH